MKQDYMARLRRWARWYLGAEEAPEVIADYEELAAGRSDAELERDFGAPRAAMGALMDKTAFYRWYACFDLMWMFSLVPLLYMVLYTSPRKLCFFPFVGCLSALWYWGVKPRTPRAPLPKVLLPALLALLLTALAISVFLRRLLTIPYDWKTFPAWLLGWHHIVTLFCVLFVGAGILGAALARLYDRRWRALYLLSQAAFVTTAVLMKPLTSLNLESAIAGEFTPYIAAWAAAAVFGLACTVWSLLC